MVPLLVVVLHKDVAGFLLSGERLQPSSKFRSAWEKH
jgi:hypothetical protein